MTATVSEARIKRAFATFDYNNKGHITHDELERILRALGFRGMSKQLVATFMRTTSTRKNPSEVTYGDCLRIIQSSGFDHIFEESFQVCQVLDKRESGRIVPEAMMRAAKADGRFDSYVPTQQTDGSFSPSTPATTFANTFRRNSIGGLSVTDPSAIGAKKYSVDTIDDDELTKGGDRSAKEGHPALGFDSNAFMSLTTTKKPLAPASAKRAAIFSQVHKFVARADDHISSPLASVVSQGASNSKINPITQQKEEEMDTALTFDEWRQVQASAEKAAEATLRRKRRNQPPPPSLTATLKASSSGIQLTPRREYSSTRQ